MTDFTSYNSFDDMMSAMAEAEHKANASLHPIQTELRDATEKRYWIRPMPEHDLVIYGEALTVDELMATEKKYWDEEPEDEREPLEEMRERLVDRRKRGYLTGKAFSKWEPTGEWGDTHVANVAPLSDIDFNTARSMEWPTRVHRGTFPSFEAKLAEMGLLG